MKTKYLIIALMWIQLVGLLGEYWYMEIFRKIGNLLEEFMKVSEQTKNKRYTTYARIYIYMDLSKDILKVVSLYWEDGEWIQQIQHEQKVVSLYWEDGEWIQ